MANMQGNKAKERIICRLALRNRCKDGDACRYFHPRYDFNPNAATLSWLNFCNEFKMGRCFEEDCRFFHVTREEEDAYRFKKDIAPALLEQAMRKALILDVALTGTRATCKRFLQGDCTLLACPNRHITRNEFANEVLNTLRNEFVIVLGSSDSDGVGTQQLPSTQGNAMSNPQIMGTPMLPGMAQNPLLGNMNKNEDSTELMKKLEEENLEIYRALDPNQKANSLEDIRARLLTLQAALQWKDENNSTTSSNNKGGLTPEMALDDYGDIDQNIDQSNIADGHNGQNIDQSNIAYGHNGHSIDQPNADYKPRKDAVPMVPETPVVDTDNYETAPMELDQGDNHPEEEDGKCQIFVGGLDRGTQIKDLENYFSRYGEIVDAIVNRDKKNFRSRGFGFVTFLKSYMARNAVKGGPHKVDGKIIEVKFPNPKTADDDGRPRSTDYSPPRSAGDRGSQRSSRDRGSLRRRADDYSPPRSTSDYSPPRSTGDYNPPRSRSDYSPPRSTGNYSPPRYADDFGPPRYANDFGPPGFGNDCGPPGFANNSGPQGFGNNCGPSGFGNDCGPQGFGNNCGPQGFANNCGPQGFGNDCGPSGFGNDCGPQGFGNNCGPQGFGNNCGPQGFGNDGGPPGFANNCGPPGFGNDGGPPGFGNNCGPQGFGNNCGPQGFGNNCGPPGFGNDCGPQGFGNNCGPPGFGNDCGPSGFGNDCGPPQLVGDFGPSRWRGNDASSDREELIPRLFVGGLSDEISTKILADYFGQYGPIVDVVSMQDPKTKRQRGFGFVEYAEEYSLQAALANAPHIVYGCKVSINRSMPRDSDKRNNPGPGGGNDGRRNVKQNTEKKERLADRLSDKRQDPPSHTETNQSTEQNQMFVGKIRKSVRKDDVKDYFMQYGVIKKIDMHLGKDKTYRYGFITFEEPEMVDNAVSSAPHELDGFPIETGYAFPKKETGPINEESPKKGKDKGSTEEDTSNHKNKSRRNENSRENNASNDTYQPCILFVGNLSLDVNEETLYDHFCKYGEIKGTDVKLDHKGISRGFGFVTFMEDISVQEAMEDGPHEIDGSEVIVGPAKTKGRERKDDDIQHERSEDTPSLTSKRNTVEGGRQHDRNQETQSQTSKRKPVQKGRQQKRSIETSSLTSKRRAVKRSHLD